MMVASGSERKHRSRVFRPHPARINRPAERNACDWSRPKMTRQRLRKFRFPATMIGLPLSRKRDLFGAFIKCREETWQSKLVSMALGESDATYCALRSKIRI